MCYLLTIGFSSIYKQKIILFLFVFAYFATFGVLVAESKILFVSNEKPLSKHFEKIELFEKDLREKTGLQSIRFNEKNELVYSVLEIPTGGSQKMRKAIIGAIDDLKNIYQISNVYNSKKINFAMADAGTIDVNTRVTTYQVKFDFADFENAKKNSDREVLDSFTLGITLFHEIDHKASYDAETPMPLHGVRPETSSGKILGVIENVNIVREELGLIPRNTKRFFGKKHRGNIYEIPFRGRFGNSKFLRWKLRS